LQHGAIPITVHVHPAHAKATPEEKTKDYLLSCTNVAGNEILRREGIEHMHMSIGSLREELGEILDEKDKRLARDGHFYSEQEFSVWYQANNMTGADAASAWDWAPVLRSAGRCNLVLPDASVLDRRHDANPLSSLLETSEFPETWESHVVTSVF
jgi:hypothetical protein